MNSICEPESKWQRFTHARALPLNIQLNMHEANRISEIVPDLCFDPDCLSRASGRALANPECSLLMKFEDFWHVRKDTERYFEKACLGFAA